MDRASQERRDGEDGELLEALLSGDRQRVGDDNLGGARLGEALRGGVGEDAVGGHDDDLLGTGIVEDVDRLGDRAGRVDHVVHQDALLAGDLADDAVCDGDVGAGGVAGLVDEGQGRAAQLLRPLLGDANAAGVGRDDGGVGQVDATAHVVHEDRHGEEVVDRAVEEALFLRGVQVDAHDAVGTGCPVQVSHEARGDGLAPLVLLVLARVRVEGSNHGDALSGSALGSVNHDELLHDPLVDVALDGLQDEHVGATNGLVEAHVNLAGGEVVGRHRRDPTSDFLAHGVSQVHVSSSRNEDEVLLSGGHQSAHAVVSPCVGSGARRRDQCADGAVWRDHRIGCDAALTDPRGGNHTAVPDFRINQCGARTDFTAGPNGGCPPQTGAGVDGGVGANRHINVDPGGGRVDDRHSGTHMGLADSAVHLGAEFGQLDAVVRTRALPVVGELKGACGAPGGGRCREDIGQVDLALIIVGAQGSQGGAQEVRVEGVDARVDLVNRGLLGGGVALLDDRGDRARGVADDASVAGGILDARGQDGDRVARALVGGDQIGQGVRRQEGDVAVGDDDGAGDGLDGLIEGLEAALDGAAGARESRPGRR